MTVAIAIVLVGYAVGYYGWNRITGGNNSFVSLVWPGKYAPTPSDAGSPR